MNSLSLFLSFQFIFFISLFLVPQSPATDVRGGPSEAVEQEYFNKHVGKVVMKNGCQKRKDRDFFLTKNLILYFLYLLPRLFSFQPEMVDLSSIATPIIVGAGGGVGVTIRRGPQRPTLHTTTTSFPLSSRWNSSLRRGGGCLKPTLVSFVTLLAILNCYLWTMDISPSVAFHQVGLMGNFVVLPQMPAPLLSSFSTSYQSCFTTVPFSSFPFSLLFSSFFLSSFPFS